MTRKAITASDAEIEANPRARSAKLRACRKIELANA
jgi:16S rRNA C1402 N4-methylase RsmH